MNNEKELYELKKRLMYFETLIEDIHDILVLDKKHCPICENDVKAFLPFGERLRPNALCPICNSLERDRLIWLFFKGKTNILTDNVYMLHIAPEKIFYEKFSKQSNIEYLTSDLNPNRPGVKVQMDIQDIQYSDNTFDVIYCSHVLEHVPDDRKAMKEIHRVLKPNGWAILQVPIKYSMRNTLENPEYNTPELRSKYYGQRDHMRYYGLDYADRLQEAGFKVDADDYVSTLSKEIIQKYSLPHRDDIFICKK